MIRSTEPSQQSSSPRKGDYIMLSSETVVGSSAQPIHASHQYMHYSNMNIHPQTIPPSFPAMSAYSPFVNDSFVCTAPAPQQMMRMMNYPCFPPDMPSHSSLSISPALSMQRERKPSTIKQITPGGHLQQQMGGMANVSSASASDSCSQISHVLQIYQQGGEDPEFVRKAIESLVKKLKDKRVELDALITAVTSSGKTPTQCVTIQRSLDGRLQVAGRKGVPHVVYARIWRWPNVTKGELQKQPCCAIASDNQDFICINPYHYERVVGNAYGPVGRRRGPKPKASKAPFFNPFRNPAGMPALWCMQHMTTLRIDPSQMPTFIPPSLAIPTPSVASSFQAMSRNMTLASSSGAAQQQCSRSPSEVTAPTGSLQGSHPSMERYDDWMSNTLVPPTCQMTQSTLNYQQPMNYTSPNIPDLSQVRIPSQFLPPFPEHWASIGYYELDTQIGETFKVSSDRKEVSVDGGMDPLGERTGRFCLGALSNVHRTEASEKARLHIGNGVLLRWMEGSLFVEVRSNKAVFVRSPFLDFCYGAAMGSMVHRLTDMNTNVGKGGLKVFDLRWAYRHMREQTETARNAVMQQAAAVAGYANPTHLPSHLPEVLAGSGVDEMQRAFCSIGMSFVKGWGQRYNRLTIKDTPCWIEVQLNRPLQILDALLKSGLNV